MTDNSRPPPEHRWADLHAPRELPREELEADAILYRCFATPEGQAALRVMHLLTTWKRNTPSESDGALRWSEAQRTFVAILEARIARHRAKPAKVDGRRTSGRKRK